MVEYNINDLFFFILIIGGIYFYNNINSKNIPKFIIDIYKNVLFKILFLLCLYLFGNYNILLTLFIAINYICLGQLIQNRELLNNI
jgi:hypothetical protein